MRRRNLMVCLVVVFAIVLGTACSEQALAAGFWNMPGTFAQRTGHGFGGGYHAPLILGPIRCDGWHLGAPVRLPYAPSPYYCGYESCGDCGRTVEAPSSLESVVPATVPAPTPMPAAAAPVETPTVEPVPATTSVEVVRVAEPVVQVAEPAVQPAVEPVVEPAPLFVAPVQQ